MKKIILSAACCLTLLPAVFAFTGPDPSRKVLESFQREFSGAENASWDKQGDFDKVVFTVSGNRIVAFFDAEGRFAGSMRNIFFNQLPLTVMTAIDKRFPEADIIDVSEITNEDGTTYRLTIEEQSKKKIVRVDASGTVSSIQKQ